MQNKVTATMSWVLSETRRLQQCARSLRWASASAALAIVLVGCGGGDGPTLLPQEQAQRDQTAAAAQAQQSVTARIAASVQPGSGTENFEAGMGDWQNWGNAQVVAGEGTSGSNALQIGPGAGGAALQVPGVVGGTAYRLSAQVRVTDPVQGPTALGVDFYDASGNRILGTRAPSNVTSTSLAAFSYDVTAPAGSDHALVWVWKDGSIGFAYVDDVTFGPATAVPPPPPPPADSNLVSNGGFEAGMTGWTDWGNTQVVTGQANSGTYALSVGNAAGGAGYIVDGISPGSNYRFSVRAKVSDASDNVYVGVNFVDAAGALVTSTQRNTSSTTYTALSADTVAPTGAVRAVVYVWKDAGSGVAYVDDFSFGVAPESAPPAMFPTSVNLVVNGNFDDWYRGWTNWGNTFFTGAANPVTYANVSQGAGGFGQSIAGVVPGKTYRLTALVRMGIAGETGYLGLKFLDASGNSVQDQVTPFGSTTYSTAQIDLVAPSDAATALVYVWKNASVGGAFVDNVSLVTVAPPSSGFTPASASPVVLANTTVAGRAVAVLQDGTRVATWADDAGVHAQKMGAQGTLVGGPLLIASSGKYPTVAALASGGYVVLYTQYVVSSSGPTPDVVTAQIVDATGSLAGAPVIVRTMAQVLVDPRYVDVGKHGQLVGGKGVYPVPDGGFIAVYLESQNAGKYDTSMYVIAQRYDAMGSPVGAATVIGDDTVSGVDPTPSGGLITGGFVRGLYGGNALFYVYDSSLHGTQAPVTSQRNYLARSPNGAGLANGSYVAIWSLDPGVVQGKLFAPAPGGGFQDVTPGPPGPGVLTFPSLASGAHVTALAGGGFLVSSGTSAQAFDNNGFAVTDVVQIPDGALAATPDGGFVVVAQVGSQLVAQQYAPMH